MQFTLLIYEPPEDFEERETERGEAHLAAWRQYYRALVEAGVYVTGSPLQPESGNRIRSLRRGRNDPPGCVHPLSHFRQLRDIDARRLVARRMVVRV